MAAWEKDPTEGIINDGNFRVTEPGPLHAPIEKFSVHRDDKLEYILKTSAPSDAKSNAVKYPSGTVRTCTERVELESIGSLKASLVGVIPRQVIKGSDERGIGETREEAKVYIIEGRFPEDREAAYSIDWLGNVSGHGFLWPDIMHTEIETTITRKLGRDDPTTLAHSHKNFSSNRSAVKLTISGVDFYLCATSPKSDEDPLKSGCIVYLGTPDDAFRAKIRNCLSFALGIYLVYLGNTTFTKDWKLVAFKSISAYSMDRKAFSLVNLPPAPLHNNSPNCIDQQLLQRVINAVYTCSEA